MRRSAAVAAGIEYSPISPSIGAVIEHLDARRHLSGPQIAELKALLMRFKVLFFPEQHLDYDEHERFAAQFGELRFDPLEHNVAGHPGLALVDNVPFFHSDWMHQEDPPRWSMLQMKSVPETGGDTMFVDLVASYEALSSPMRTFLETLTVHQSMTAYTDDGSELARSYAHASEGRFVDLEARHDLVSDQDDFDYALVMERVQPHDMSLVRRIPETGQNNYWVSRTFTQRINELEPQESRVLLDFLFAHQLQPQFAIRWKWRAGDIAFWDHRTTLHSGVKDYGSFARFGCRASLAGGRLIPASATT